MDYVFKDLNKSKRKEEIKLLTLLFTFMKIQIRIICAFTVVLRYETELLSPVISISSIPSSLLSPYCPNALTYLLPHNSFVINQLHF